MKKPRPILAIDPGKVAGIALVVPGPVANPKPLLLGAWVVRGSTQRSWLNHAQAAIAEAATLSPGPWQVVAEKDAPARRRDRDGDRGAGGDKYGLATVAGMGRYRGYLMALAWTVHPKHEPRRILQRKWARGLRVPIRKNHDDGGAHRLRECRALMRAETYPDDIDAAEAALIGAAVAYGY